MKRLLPTLLVLIASATAATPALAADGAGMRKVCADRTYVRHTPALTVVGTLFKHQKIDVKRYSKSGKYAYGFAWGHARKHGWVKTTDLCD